MRFFQGLLAFILSTPCFSAWADSPPATYPDTLKLYIPAPPTGARAHVQLGFSVATDGNFVAIGAPFDGLTENEAGTVKILDAATGHLQRVIRNPNSGPSRGAFDHFGYTVAVSGEILVVGAPGDDTGADSAGRVYVFDLTAPAAAGPLAILNDPTPATGDQFGFAAAISGSRILVGCPFRSVGANTVGCAYVYDLTSPTPTQPVVSVPNSAPGTFPHFGQAVAISGSQGVIGAPGASDGSGGAYIYDFAGANPTVPVRPLDNVGAGATDSFGQGVAISGNHVAVAAPLKDLGNGGYGAVLVYDLLSATPSASTANLLNPEGALNGYFAASVAIRGTQVLVGAPATTVGGVSAGRAYAYDVAGASPGVPLSALSNPAPDAGDSFANAIAIGTKVIIGAPGDDARATDAGSVYLYDWPGSAPGSPIPFNEPSPSLNDGFGYSMSTADARVLIGAPGFDTEDPEVVAGSARLYDLASSAPGTPVAVFENPTSAQKDRFGFSVAVSGKWAAIGAPSDDTAALEAGAVYVYDLGSGTPTSPLLTLTKPSAASGDHFGYALVLSGTTLAVGAPAADTAGPDAGAVYIYDLSSETPGTPILTLLPPSPMALGDFGRFLALHGRRLVAASPRHGSSAGYAGIFDLGSATPTIPQTTLAGADPGGETQSVAIEGNTVAVASQGAALIYDLGATVPGEPVLTLNIAGSTDHSIAISGAFVAVGTPAAGGQAQGVVELFDLTRPIAFFPIFSLHSPNPHPVDLFGRSLGFIGGSLAVGAYGDDTTALNKGAATLFGPAQNDIDGDGLQDLWEAAHFGTLTGHSAAGDADGDGSTELVELAFNHDPLVSDATSAPATVIEGGYLTLTINKRGGATYLGESAATPANTDFSAATTTVLIDTATTLKLRDNFPVATPGGRFLRVRVTAAP